MDPTLIPPHRHFLNKKFALITFAILICAGAGYAAVHWYNNKQLASEVAPTVTPRPNSTAGWQTYTNTQYGFEFKYPSDWVVKENPDNSICFISPTTLRAMTNKNYEAFCGDLMFDTQSFLSTATKESIKTEVINGLKFTYYSGGEGIETANYEIVKDNTTYHFMTGSVDKTKEILSTFKFTSVGAIQIFQESSSQLHLTQSQLVYFRIFGNDRIQYSLGSGTNFAYKYNGKWQIAGTKDNQAVQNCADLSGVPQQYRPPCDDNKGQLLYADTQGQSVNYPPSQAISYIGQ